MRTGRSLTVCWHLLPGGGSGLVRGGVGVWSGGCLVPGGVYSQGVPGPGGSALGGAWSGGCPSMHWGRSPLLWTESQTPVKTLPWPNFVAAGKDGKAQEKSIFCNIVLNCHVAQEILQVLTPFFETYIGGSKGDARDAPSHLSSIPFIFMQFSAKLWPNNWLELPPPPKILDPPLT